MTELSEKPKRSIVTLIWLIVSQLIAVATLLFWVIAAGLSVMAFDEGSSPEAWRFVIAVWAYPLFPLVMAIGAWVAFAFRKNRLAAILSGLTFVPAGLLYLLARFANLIGL
jgi:uncharacterized BrkB/YihY/UPF0761 family membrane protein